MGKWDKLGKKALQATDLLGLWVSHFKKQVDQSGFLSHFIKNSILKKTHPMIMSFFSSVTVERTWSFFPANTPGEHNLPAWTDWLGK